MTGKPSGVLSAARDEKERKKKKHEHEHENAIHRCRQYSRFDVPWDNRRISLVCDAGLCSDMEIR